MADNVTVAVTRGQPVVEIVTFSDEANNNMSIVGVPGTQYNLAGLPGAPTITAIETGSTVDSTVGSIFNTSVQVPANQQLISFTDSLGNNLNIIGSPNTYYDLNVLSYLLAIVNALDFFMTATYGDAYEQYKHEALKLVTNLE